MGRTVTPHDRGWCVGIIFFILGLGTLLPWNFFMTASLYFQRRLNTTELSNNETEVVRKEYYFNNWMTLLSQLPLLLFTLLTSFLYQRVSEMVRIAGSLVFILLLFILTAVLVKVPMDEERFFSVTMATIWFINSFGAVLQGSLFGLVGQLPQKYSAIFMSGQGLAGTFAAVAMLLAIASEADSETAALGYFITPCVGTLLTLFSYLLLPRLVSSRLDMLSIFYTSLTALPLTPCPSCLLVFVAGIRPVLFGQKRKTKFLCVLLQIWVMAFCVTFVFTVTLSVFPAVTADVRTVFPGKWEHYFISVCCFLTFNINDWLGRTITTLFQWPGRDSRLFPVLVVSRVVFVPLLMLCNVQTRSYLPIYFPHDAAFTAIMAVFAFSSGYFACLSMSYAPQMVEPKDAETAGALMTFFLALGLSTGAALSFPFRAWV
uniref:Solute carrier family 29 member 2 n=1 Tax=Neogobius melanostomus TaxID=47308 RepID=A0A8C6WU76_9GOBI